MDKGHCTFEKNGDRRTHALILSLLSYNYWESRKPSQEADDGVCVCV